MLAGKKRLSFPASRFALFSNGPSTRTHTLLLSARGLAGGLGFRYLENAIGSSRPINAGDNKSANYSHQFPFPFNDRPTCKFNGPAAAGLTRGKNPHVCACVCKHTDSFLFGKNVSGASSKTARSVTRGDLSGWQKIRDQNKQVLLWFYGSINSASDLYFLYFS
jgi:hypothetical protein